MKKRTQKQRTGHRALDTNKLNDLVFRVWISTDLKEDVAEMRARFGIPYGGFFISNNLKTDTSMRNNALRDAWLVEIENNQSRYNSFLKELGKLIKRYGLPPTSKLLLKEYVLAGVPNLPVNGVENFSGIDLSLYPLNKKLDFLKDWDRSKIPYLPIIIPSFVTLGEAQEYLKENWAMFENLWSAQGYKKQDKEKTRIIKNKDMIDRILYLMSQPAKEKGYKEIEVRKILQEEFTERNIPQSENIRTLNQRYKKDKK